VSDQVAGAPGRSSSVPAVAVSTLVTYDGVVPVLCLNGELDLSVSAELRRAAIDLRDSIRGNGLVIDLTDTTFADSCGVAGLLAIRRMFPGQPVRLRGVCRQVQRTLELLGLEDVFEQAATGC
jgi:anti-anti-sigma factor